MPTPSARTDARQRSSVLDRNVSQRDVAAGVGRAPPADATAAPIAHRARQHLPISSRLRSDPARETARSLWWRRGFARVNRGIPQGALDDRAVEQPLRRGHAVQNRRLAAAAGLAEDRHASRVAAKRIDVVAHPFQRQDESCMPTLLACRNCSPPISARWRNPNTLRRCVTVTTTRRASARALVRRRRPSCRSRCESRRHATRPSRAGGGCARARPSRR